MFKHLYVSNILHILFTHYYCYYYYCRYFIIILFDFYLFIKIYHSSFTLISRHFVKMWNATGIITSYYWSNYNYRIIKKKKICIFRKVCSTYIGTWQLLLVSLQLGHEHCSSSGKILFYSILLIFNIRPVYAKGSRSGGFFYIIRTSSSQPPTDKFLLLFPYVHGRHTWNFNIHNVKAYNFIILVHPSSNLKNALVRNWRCIRQEVVKSQQLAESQFFYYIYIRIMRNKWQ